MKAHKKGVVRREFPQLHRSPLAWTLPRCRCGLSAVKHRGSLKSIKLRFRHVGAHTVNPRRCAVASLKDQCLSWLQAHKRTATEA
jgi:hypothetical protein